MSEPTQILESIRSAKNTTGSDLAEGAVVVIDDTNAAAREVKLPAAATDGVYGVVCNGAIADGAWGDVCIRGIVKCNAEGALATKGIRVQPTTAGRVDTHGTTNSIVGILLTESAAQDDKVLVELLGPGSAGI